MAHRFPDLLCIGTQRAGTTWLWNNLSLHPDFFTPPFKELDYLNLRGTVPPPGLLAFRQRALKGMLHEHEHGVPHTTAEVNWFARFAGARRNDDAWYASLFHGVPADRIAIDFSPSYCTMDDRQVARVSTLMPRARILVMLRDPLDRAWSQLSLEATLGKAPLLRGPADFQRWCQSANVSRRHAYASILARWRAAFGSDRVFVATYEEVQRTPTDLLARLCQWLGVDPDPGHFEPFVHTTFNRKATRSIPPDLARAAAPVMLPHLVPLRDGPDAPLIAPWLERCLRLLQA